MQTTVTRTSFLAGAAAALAACGGGGYSSIPVAVVDDKQYGALLNDAEFAASPPALPAAATATATTRALASAGSRVMLTNLPAIAQQGGNAAPNFGHPGTCESQSWAYGLGSYTSARSLNGTILRDPAQSDGANAVSASWMYSLNLAGPSKANGACPKGTLATPYLMQLVTAGGPSAQQFPYQKNASLKPFGGGTEGPACAYLTDLYQQTPANPGRFLIGSYATFRRGTDQTAFVNLVKGYLNAGMAVAMSGLVTDGYQTPAYKRNPPAGTSYLDANGVWQATVGSGGHGQLIVGYDDSISAFLIQNSFGTQWPGVQTPAPAGMLWWAYATVFATQTYFGVAYPANTSGTLSGTPLTPSIGTAPLLSAALKTFTPAAGGAGLVLSIDAANAITLVSSAIVTPANETFTTPYNNPIRTGYTAFMRSSGTFAPGSYKVTLSATIPNSSAPAYSYTGTVVL